MRVCLVAVPLLAAGGTASLSQPAPHIETGGPEQLPEGPGREETFYACTACHSFRLVSQQGMSRERWDSTLDWMTERHGMPPLEGEERGMVLQYLARHYPPAAPSSQRGWKNPFAPQ